MAKKKQKFLEVGFLNNVNFQNDFGIPEHEEVLLEMLVEMKLNFRAFIEKVNNRTLIKGKLSQTQCDNLCDAFGNELHKCDNEHIKKLYEATFFKSEGK